ncbi:MAG: Ribosome recycling factor, partial [uncultured Acidimicrobiales bacterium]
DRRCPARDHREDGEGGEPHLGRLLHRPHRAGHAGPGGEDQGRLLRRRGAAAAAGRVQRARAPGAGGGPIRQELHEGHREGPHAFRPGYHPIQRRSGDTPCVSAAHDGSTQGLGTGGEAQGRRGPDCDSEPAAGGSARARGLREGRRDLGGRARPGREGAREAHPRVRRRDRPGAGAQGARAARSL